MYLPNRTSQLNNSLHFDSQASSPLEAWRGGTLSFGFSAGGLVFPYFIGCCISLRVRAVHWIHCCRCGIMRPLYTIMNQFTVHTCTCKQHSDTPSRIHNYEIYPVDHITNRVEEDPGELWMGVEALETGRGDRCGL